VSALCPGCTVKTFDVSASAVDANQTVPMAVSQMRTNTGYKYLFFDNGEYADGIVPALKNAGLTDVKVGGRSLDQDGLAALKTTGGAWTGTNYNWIGYSLVDVAARHVEGMPIPAADSDGVWQLITSNNVHSVALPYTTPTDALDQFKKLWHVG
jgi:ABC-type sugar transport system substrate-binding protein